MEIPDIARRLEQFLRAYFAIAEDDPGFSRSVDLFDAGYVDSVGLVETLAYITSTFDIKIPDEALLSDAFSTINGMAQVIGLILEEADAEPIVQMS